MKAEPPAWFGQVLATLLARQDLSSLIITEMMRDFVAGRVGDVWGAAILIALRMKGETAEELAAAAGVLREQMVRLVPVSGPVLDTCGTGGDHSGTFNISTAAALVVSAAGVPVVKHGNRAVSSRSGSADVLRELGVPIDSGPVWAQKCLDRLGFAFCYAPHFHGGMAHVASIRRKLGVRTIFNLLGPLANPANAPYHLLGVGEANLLDRLAGALAELATARRAVVVWSEDGLDEVSLAAPCRVRVVCGDGYVCRVWQPQDFGLGTVSIEQIRVPDAAASAHLIRQVLAGKEGPAWKVVVANAAAALWAAEQVPDLRTGVEQAVSTIRQGRPQALLEQLIQSHQWGTTENS
ncbi:MAG: anthranilate phosphoribosyltransferase [Gemmataceae bacterium]|nr:anthranilate phosphoribosyltransferase [Gemmataceae bacterium]MCS7270202.1 anthranilate phosphoribosyltransferase [Gemmataceae bacterium]MDW8242138.1 anthranilate phosphoribosyltransferase [Thermogemmata sp.]